MGIVSVKTGFWGWTISIGGRASGSLKMASLTQFFLNVGRARLRLLEEDFELSYPQRAAHLLANRDAEVTLFKGSQAIFKLIRDEFDNKKFLFQISDQDFVATRTIQGFQVVAGEKLVARMSQNGLIFPSYEICGEDQRLSPSILVTLLWAMICPVKRLQ
jgi:hypothetical protein